MKKIIFNVDKVNTELTTTNDEVIVFNEEGEFHYFKGKYHCEDGPAAITKDYSSWMKNGLITRDEKEGPAVTRNKMVTNFYHYSKIQIPTIKNSYEYKFNQFVDIHQIEYWKDGKLHRDNGPAITITFKIDNNSYLFEYWFKNSIPFNKENEYSSCGYKNNKLIFYQCTNKKGLLHRDDGKSAHWGLDNDNLEFFIFYKDGIQHGNGDLPSYMSGKLSMWKQNGDLHRLNKPSLY